MQKIDAIILAGGRGERLRSVVKGIPKPLAKVCEKPFLDILFSQLNGSNLINSVTLAVGYRAQKIIEQYSESFPYSFEVIFCVEKKLLGTGGAVKKAIPYTKSKDILVMNGDSYTGINLGKFIEFHREHRSKLTIALRNTSDTSRFGNVNIDSACRVFSFKEKDNAERQGLINTGIYLMNKDIFDDIKKNAVLSLENDIVPLFINKFKNKIYGYQTRGKFIDIGTPESYISANNYLSNC
jgi:NDP-sugar pyrophosphorylase family protein